MKTFFVTYAQNATPVHDGFWKAIQVFCKARKAKLLVVPGKYRNPTSRHVENGEDDWWAKETLEFLTRTRVALCANLKVFGDISIQPTAENPLSGFEGMLGASSGIFGHAQRALEVVPTSTRSPRVMWTTSSCTISNYSKSKAGAKGKHHHTIGGLVVEVDKDGAYFVRHVTANTTGEFTDLSTTYSAHGYRAALPASSVVLGDYHVGKEDELCLAGTEKLVRELKPKNVCLHDVLDFSSRNHHEKSRRARYEGRFATVKAEVQAAREALLRVRGWCPSASLYVVRSNHDEFFEKWLDSADPDRDDPINAPYYHEVWARAYQHKEEFGYWPNLFEQEVDLASVEFLGLESSLKIQGVEHAFHGHIGMNGSKGNPRTYARLGTKVTTGHTHVPRICRGSYVAGLTARLDHGYNKKPSAWLQAHVVQYADGKRAIVILVKGRYKGNM